MPAIAWLLAPKPVAVPHPRPRPAETAPQVEPPAPHQARTARPSRPSEPSSSAAADDDAPVTGTVLDPDGKPTANAFVGCDDRDTVLATSSDEEGHFRLASNASGCLAVANHPSFIVSDRTELVAGRDNVIRLSKGGAIDGEVVDERGTPIAKYTISIESYRGKSVQASPLGLVKAIQDARGAFLWDNLVPGAYVLQASADGRPPTRSDTLDVEAARTTHHVRIVVPRGATLSGRVIDAATRKPLAGATIGFDALTSTGMGGSGYARADDNGAYSLPGAPPGPFSIRVAREGYTSRIVTGLLTRGADTIKQDIELKERGDGGPRDEFGGVGAVLAPTAEGVLFGRVFSGAPAASAGVKQGDRIRRIDGVDASTLTLSDCVQRLRGPDGSIVSVQVERGGKLLDIGITRRVVAR